MVPEAITEKKPNKLSVKDLITMRQRGEFPTVVKIPLQRRCWWGIFWFGFHSAPTQPCNLKQQHVSVLVWDCDISREERKRRKAVESRSLEMKPLWVHHCIPRILTRPQSRLISDWVEIPRDRCANVYRWSSLYLLSPALSLSFCFETKTNLVRRESGVWQTPN